MAGITFNVFDGINLQTIEYYGKTLVELAKEHPQLVGLSADLAKSTKIGIPS